MSRAIHCDNRIYAGVDDETFREIGKACVGQGITRGQFLRDAIESHLNGFTTVIHAGRGESILVVQELE